MAIRKTSKPDNKIEVVNLEQFRPDENNANKGTERGLRILDDSLRELGAGRSILVDKHGVILAGNKTQERAVDIGLTDAIVVHTNGTQLVVVQRDDLDATEPAGRKMGLLDNRSSEVGLAWDPVVLAGMLESDPQALKGLFEDWEVKQMLGEGVTDPNGEWQGMPDFKQEDALGAFHSLTLHFASEGDMEQFAELVGQRVTDKTKYVWIPKQEHIDGKAYRAE